MKYLFIFLLLFQNVSFAVVKKGGHFKYNLKKSPATLNPFTSVDLYGALVHRRIFETLLRSDISSNELKPSLAKEWKVLKDGSVFEFVIRDGVKWHDGKPLTVNDVKFTFDAIIGKDNKFQTISMRKDIENVSKVKIVSKNTIHIYVQKKHFLNLKKISTDIFILPKHFYENANNNFSKSLIGTGPYILKDYDRSKKILLEKNSKWWGIEKDFLKEDYNFNKITMKFIRDETIALQELRKGNIDFSEISLKGYYDKSGNSWGKDYFKIQYENESGRSFGVFGLNLNDARFKDKRVRLALTQLLNRQMLSEKFFFGQAEIVNGPVHPSSPYADNSVKEIKYDPSSALANLREAGWKDTDGDAILDKLIDGKKVDMKFTVKIASKKLEKYLTMYKEDAKKAGIKLEIQFLEWNSYLDSLLNRNFEVIVYNTGTFYDWDPTNSWHSKSISKTGQNFISYKNNEVDKLIDKQRLITNQKDRTKILKKIYNKIAKDIPSVFLFSYKYKFYAHRNRVKKKKDAYKFALGVDKMWID